MAKRTLHKKRKNKQKTRKIKGGNYYNYTIFSNDGFNGGIIIPNLPFISDELITKVGTEPDIKQEFDAYNIIRKLNDNQYEYERMLIKILCEPTPIMFPINKALLDDININKAGLIIKPQYTHAMIMKKGDNNLFRIIYINKNNILQNINIKLKEIIKSLGELNKNQYIHGDIKLNNLLVFNDNIYLIDFGTFIYYDDFKKSANNNTNKLSIFLEHIPFEAQYINKDFDINKIKMENLDQPRFKMGRP
jgi:tRNA A-37 threonylcarbamoyl transferase component Bud32